MSDRRQLHQSQQFYREFFSKSQALSADNRERYEVVFALVDSLNLPPSVKVLDIGTGAGRIARFLSQRFSDVISIDITSTVLMEKTRYEHRHLSFSLAALPHLPFPNNTFHLVICSEVLEHLQRGIQSQAISEIGRIVVTGGKVVISTPNPDGFYEKARRFGALLKYGKPERQGQLLENYVSPHLLQRILEKEFTIDEKRGSFYLFPPFNRLARKVPFLYGLSENIGRKGWFVSKGLYQYYLLNHK